MKNKRLSILLLIVILLVGCSNNKGGIIKGGNGNEVPDPIEEIIEADPIDEIIKTMTLEEKIGQLLIVGKEGLEFNEDDRFQIDVNKVGGFIFFARNIENEVQVPKLLNDLKEYNSKNKAPLFLSIDEEGGMVSRLSKIYKSLPEAKIIGDKNDMDISFEYGEILGQRLKELGFNLNFAPVLDINSNSKNPVIGSRAFGSTVGKVIDNGLSVMEGINSQGIISSVKHFPGHGDTSMDSHIDVPIVDKSYTDLESLELIPFKEAIKKDVDMIMVAHILFPQIDLDFPATLSKEIITNILRLKLNYDGVVISDDITMGAIQKNYTIEDATVKFFTSGGDIVLVCHGKENPTLIIQKIKESIDNNEFSIEELDEKVYRILSLKHKYNIEDIQVESKDIKRINDKTIIFIDKIKA